MVAKYFYPPPPRGGRPSGLLVQPFRQQFLSTPSARRATSASVASTSVQSNFYPRPPRGGRPRDIPQYVALSLISIHALREEGDGTQRTQTTIIDSISIHALREEGDPLQKARKEKADNFYPRPPRGGRRAQFASGWSASKFLSTPSARRATSQPTNRSTSRPISIHTLREEGDLPSGCCSAQ